MTSSPVAPDYSEDLPAQSLGGGRWRIQVPIPSGTLASTSIYALEVRDGVALVDAGWHSPEGMRAIERGLEVFGAKVSDVVGIVVTHVHADHYGLAPHVRAQSGAWVALHRDDTALLLDGHQLDHLVERAKQELMEQGAPLPAAELLTSEWHRVLAQYRMEAPDLVLDEGRLGELRGRDLRVWHTPGHTAGHVCLAEETDGILYTGDHVLPKISPNVSAHFRSAADPIRQHLGSLAQLEGRLVLPGHGAPFGGLRKRIHRLAGGHERRSNAVVSAMHHGADTAWRIAEQMRWSSPWSQLGPAHQRLALGEVQAHLQHLRARGRVSSHTDPSGVQRWALVHDTRGDHDGDEHDRTRIHTD